MGNSSFYGDCCRWNSNPLHCKSRQQELRAIGNVMYEKLLLLETNYLKQKKKACNYLGVKLLNKTT